MMISHRRRALSIAVGAAFGLPITIAFRQPAHAAYPDRPIRLIVPFPPSGPNDILARLVGQRLSEQLGKQVLIDNRPGGSTIIGSEIAVRSPPDGYTLLMVSPSHVINPGLRATMPYDLMQDFVPVIEVARSPNVLVTNTSLPVSSVSELLDLARSKPGQLNYGSGGIGTATHLAGAMLCDMGRVTMNHVPYKGDGPATTDLIGGQIAWMFGTILSVKPHIDAGRLKAIALSGTNRLPDLPDVPTVAETIPGFDATSLYGIVAPAGTPAVIVGQLNAALQKVISAPEFKEQLRKDGTEAVGGSSADFGAHLQAAIKRWTAVIRSAGIKPA